MAQKTEYERLPDIVDISTVGIPKLTATLIERTDNKALYLRSDGMYETFRIKKQAANEMFGRSYPNRELYPGNEEFGVIAWTYRNLRRAHERYATIPDEAVYLGTLEGE